MPSALDTALAPLGSAAVALLKTEFDAQEPALAAAIEAQGTTLIQAIATKIEAALPAGGVLASVESSVLKPAIQNVATALAAQLPAGVNYLDGVVDNELAAVEKTLSAL